MYYNSDWQTGALATGLEEYMPTLPVDPINEALRSYSGGHSLCYYSRSYGGDGQWYMLVFLLEGQNATLDAQDGVRACDGTFFNYGNEDGYIITVGGSCAQ